jgi:hypothetical protein
MWVAASPATAQKNGADAAPPAQIERLLACRAQADPAKRFACLDRETNALAEAIARRDIVAVDRERIRSTRRSLFGMTVPRLGLFGGDEGEELKQVEGVLASAGRNRDGGYIFRLEDGVSWTQTDDKPIAIRPQRGDQVVVKRGALGSYILSVKGQPGVKVQRVN